MDSKNSLISEYDCIKNEIQNKIELHNNLTTFTITTIVALLAFAFSKDNPFLFLVPFCVLIPMSSRIAYYRLALSKLSAYIIVFLEPVLDGCEWETRNYLLVNRNISNKRKSLKNSIIMNSYEFFIFSIVCYGLFLFHYIRNEDFTVILVINISWPLLLIVYEFALTKRINSVDKKKKEWISQWNTLKQIEFNERKEKEKEDKQKT